MSVREFITNVETIPEPSKCSKPEEDREIKQELEEEAEERKRNKSIGSQLYS